MGVFLSVAQGVDVLPLKMAIERQGAVFDDGSEVGLFEKGEWRGEFFAFPQLRSILLDLMRRLECAELHSITLVRVGGVKGLVKVEDSNQAVALLGLDDLECTCAGELTVLAPGAVVWCSGIDEMLLQGVGYALAVYFSSMP